MFSYNMTILSHDTDLLFGEVSTTYAPLVGVEVVGAVPEILDKA
jgi:hypothetical protein